MPCIMGRVISGEHKTTRRIKHKLICPLEDSTVASRPKISYLYHSRNRSSVCCHYFLYVTHAMTFCWISSYLIQKAKKTLNNTKWITDIWTPSLHRQNIFFSFPHFSYQVNKNALHWPVRQQRTHNVSHTGRWGQKASGSPSASRKAGRHLQTLRVCWVPPQPGCHLDKPSDD